MQSTKTAQEFKTVYETNTRAPWELRHFTDGEFSVYESLHNHYACGDLLRLDARVHINGLAVFKMTCMHMEAIFDAIKKFCGDAYQIAKIEMRLNAQEFDRWIDVPKEMMLIRLHGSDCFGVRWEDGRQAETAIISAINLSENFAAYRHRVTHIYIPSTENKEIPIYPCEPHGVKKVEPKSIGNELHAKCEAEYEKTVAKRTGLKQRRNEINQNIRELEQERAELDAILLQMKIDLNTNYGPWPLPHHIPSFDAKTQAAVTGTAKKLTAEIVRRWNDLFGNDGLKFAAGGFATGGYTKDTSEMLRPGEFYADLSSPFSQGTLKELSAMWDASAERLKYATVAQLKNPATVKAAIEHLHKQGDRETLTTLYRLTNTALFKMQWDAATARKSGDDKAGEHY